MNKLRYMLMPLHVVAVTILFGGLSVLQYTVATKTVKQALNCGDENCPGHDHDRK